jgi:glycosyltransferase involved in cell wall biosynthesis
VDDGSTDGTWEWLLQQRDVTSIRQPNQGQTWAINLGTRSVTGMYVRFLDSDDELVAGTIDRQFEAAVETGADVVYGRVDLREEESGRIESFPDTPLWDDFIAVMLGEGYGSHFLGMLFRTTFVADIPRRPEFALREDRMYLLEVALRNPRIAPTSGCAGYWTKHSRQMHTGYRGLQTTVAAWQMLKLYERTLETLRGRDELTPRRARAAARVLWPVAHAIGRAHLPEAAALAKRVFELDPGFIPPEGPIVRLLYSSIGYVATQRLFRIRRALLGRG